MMIEKTPTPLTTEKTKLRVVFITERNRVEGEVHIANYSRLTDLMNAANNHFIAVTRAKVYNLPEGESVYALDFLDINKNSVIICFPATYSAQQVEAK